MYKTEWSKCLFSIYFIKYPKVKTLFKITLKVSMHRWTFHNLKNGYLSENSNRANGSSSLDPKMQNHCASCPWGIAYHTDNKMIYCWLKWEWTSSQDFGYDKSLLKTLLTFKALRYFITKRQEGGSGWGTHVNPWLIYVNIGKIYYNIVK